MPECIDCPYAESIEKLRNDVDRLSNLYHANDKSIGIVNEKLDNLTNNFSEMKASTAENFRELKTMITDLVTRQGEEKEKQVFDMKDNKKQWKWAVVGICSSILGGIVVAIAEILLTNSLGS